MNEQCKVSEPAGLADDTEGEENKVTGFSSCCVAQAGIRMSFQTANSDLNNLMFLLSS